MAELVADPKPILELIEQNELPLAAEELYEALDRPGVERFLRTVFRGDHLEPGPAHKLLGDLPFDAILATNFDPLLEFALPRTHHFTQLDDAELTDWMRSPHPSIVKIHGDIDRANSIVLRAEDYNKLKFDNAPLRLFLTHVFTARTVIFAGCSLNDPDLELLLEQLQFQLQGRLGPHFALMRRKEMNSAKAKSLKRRLGIEILGSEDDDGYPDIAAFLSQLPKRRYSTPPPAPVRPVDRAPGDIRKLLEAMGHRIYDHKENCFLGEYRSGAEFRHVITRHFSPAPTLLDVERMGQAVAKYCVDEGILLSEEPMQADVLAEARTHGLKAYHRPEFVDRLANFQPYLERLEVEYRASEIDRYFIPLKIREERDDQPAPAPLDEFIDGWLADPERNHLSLLGDFGTGKTWFCRRLAQRLIERRALDGNGRIPILIPLRDDPRAYVARQLITDAVLNRFKVELPAGFETFEYLNDEGRLVIIRDGFDEMERRVSDFKTAEEKFWKLAKLVSPKAKVILTCRTAFFRYQKEADEILHGDLPKVRLLHKDDFIELRGKHG